MATIHRLLVANRGEIARRVMRTAHNMGISTVAVYSEGDADAPFVRDADLAIALGGRSATESYLDMSKVLEAAERTGADAIHPGYGFLSENASFAATVGVCGFTFIGPPAELIQMMGDKILARKAMVDAGLKTLPGCEDAIGDADEARELAEEQFNSSEQSSECENAYWSAAIPSGAIPLCHYGCAARDWLVVTGQEAGNVWHDARAEHHGVYPVESAGRRRTTFSEWYLHWIEESLQKLAAPLRQGGLDVATAVCEGYAATVIVEEAGSRDADLIVIGTHGLSGLKHLLLGSIAERVVQKAPCPVLTVKAPEAYFRLNTMVVSSGASTDSTIE